MSLEDDIRSTLLDDRRELPGWPDAADRVHAGMRRRARRRRLAIAAAGLVALAIAVPVTLVPAHRGPARPPLAVVPWGGDVLVSGGLGMPAGPVPLPYDTCQVAGLRPQAV